MDGLGSESCFSVFSICIPFFFLLACRTATGRLNVVAKPANLTALSRFVFGFNLPRQRIAWQIQPTWKGTRSPGSPWEVIATIDRPAFVAYTKKVASEGHHHDRDTNGQRPAGHGRAARTRCPRGARRTCPRCSIDEFRANTILAALCTFPDHDAEAVKGILRDFARAMQTRMREQVKVATCLLKPGMLVLCHCAAATTMTRSGRVIRRLLDTDNVIGYAKFTLKDDSVEVAWHEREKSSSFSTWLGIPDQHPPTGPRAKSSVISGMSNGVQVSVEILDANAGPAFFDHPAIRPGASGTITIGNLGIELENPRFKRGKVAYASLPLLVAAVKDALHGADVLRERYDAFRASLDAYRGELWDDLGAVVDPRDGHAIVDKSHPEWTVTFCGGPVVPSSRLVEAIATAMASQESITIFHPALPVADEPLVAHGLGFANELGLPVQRC